MRKQIGNPFSSFHWFPLGNSGGRGSKQMIELVEVHWPSGAVDPRVFCPACGSPVLNPITGDGPTCHHVQFIIDSESKDFNYITEEFETLLKEYREENSLPDSEWSLVDSFIESEDSNTFFVMDLYLASNVAFEEAPVCLRIGFQLYFIEDQLELYEELESRREGEDLHDHSQN